MSCLASGFRRPHFFYGFLLTFNRNDDVEADIQFSSSPDNKEISSTPENLSSTSSPRSEASESDWQPPTHGRLLFINFLGMKKFLFSY